MERLTRTVLAAGTALTVGTGVGLWLLARDTSDYWAWTIAAPLSAAFLGAGFAGAAVSLALALRTRRGASARPVLVSALTFTTLSLAVSVRHLDELRLGEGPALPRAVAWIWLVVYAALPPLALATLVLELRGSMREVRALPLHAGELGALGALGGVLGGLGSVLVAEQQDALDLWPWPLSPLAGALVGAWLLASAVTLIWVSLYERDWGRARPSAAGAAVFGVLLLGAAARFHGDFDSGAGAAAYACAVTAALLVLGAVAASAEHRAAAPAAGAKLGP
jgi:hypothetical protein